MVRIQRNNHEKNRDNNANENKMGKDIPFLIIIFLE